MMYSQCRLEITHFPNGDRTPELGNHILHLMPDKSVIGAPFGPTIIDGGKCIVDSHGNKTIRFEWEKDRPDISGFLEISNNEFSTCVGCGYSGSCYKQSIPTYKLRSVGEWIELFDK